LSDFHEIYELDCDEENIFPADPKNNQIIRDIVKHKQYDRLRLKTKYITKEYDSKFNLLTVEPFFIDVRFSVLPEGAKFVEEYTLKSGAKARIFMDARGTNYIYTIQIPEMSIRFYDVMKLYELVEIYKKDGFVNNDIINRWYKNYGILEHLMYDENILEININPPAYKTSLRIVHAKYQECTSNVYASNDFLNYLLTRMKIETGRPVNRVQPQIDGEIRIGNIKGRVAGIISPFSVFGYGFSIRKHREHPWTLPLFITNGSVNYLFSGFMNFVISHGRSFLTAGPRGSGKTSLLGSLLLEILQKYRIITIEDTQELPIEDYKKLGYDILPLKVRSALMDSGMEMPFDKGLRTSLRLGDSALVVGEVRSVEAKVLYEAMRVGAMSNVVAGTIHADSPYGVYDRVVNDLGVPKGSFKATDIIIIQNLIKDQSGLGRKRRVIRVTEVLKEWEDKPVFQDLFIYNPNTDTLEPTDFLLNGKSMTLKNIMERTQGYNDYSDVLRDIELRAWAKQVHVEISQKKEQLEATYVSAQNNLFMRLLKEIKPMESETNMQKFMDKYVEEMREILSDSNVPD
jgi:type IV secretory pathway ATPase VirB11/archaellum biosynthesis ATPase